MTAERTGVDGTTGWTPGSPAPSAASATPATLGAWVAAGTPPAPTELLAYMAHDLGHTPSGDVASPLLRACEEALDRVLAATESTRGAALDLLSADAYVTYAFEAAATDPARIATLADEAMRRISTRACAHLEAE